MLLRSLNPLLRTLIRGVDATLERPTPMDPEQHWQITATWILGSDDVEIEAVFVVRRRSQKQWCYVAEEWKVVILEARSWLLLCTDFPLSF